ncbi:diacylglycerol kinase family protein [Kordiimonas pumila]|uniref:Diacylglycerol kinase family protein n=1 Tax=Kordiimonas pumila TaxID=2161677 RepID=A0ABV7D2V3_9PROT|nr:diacylglycerol kinase family protein [Kordiimonas pumila]
MQLDKTNLKSGAVVPLVAIVSNPLSTTNAGGMHAIRKLLNESANVVHFELNGIETVDEALSLFGKANPAMLIINGGDGTIGAVLASIVHKNPFKVIPPIAFMPGGKTNMTASDLGFKGRPIRVLKKLLLLAKEGRIPEHLTTRSVIEMDLGDGELPRVGTFFGTAGVVKGIFWCRENAYSMGLPNTLAHFVSFTKLLVSAIGFGREKNLLVSDPMTISIPGSGRMAGQYASVVATTLDKLLLGLRPYGKEGVGGLGFSAIESGSGNLFRAFKGLVTGSFGTKTIHGSHVRRSNEIRIEGTDPVTLDGEIYHPIAGIPITLRGSTALTFISLK